MDWSDAETLRAATSVTDGAYYTHKAYKTDMEEGEYLIIACRSFDRGLDKAYDNITVKKIPQMLLERCEFGKTDYNLNIVHPPVYDDCDEEEQDV